MTKLRYKNIARNFKYWRSLSTLSIWLIHQHPQQQRCVDQSNRELESCAAASVGSSRSRSLSRPKMLSVPRSSAFCFKSLKCLWLTFRHYELSFWVRYNIWVKNPKCDIFLFSTILRSLQFTSMILALACSSLIFQSLRLKRLICCRSFTINLGQWQLNDQKHIPSQKDWMLLAARMSIVQPLNRAALQAPPTRKK